MPATVLYKGPKPPLGEKWCFLCVAFMKAQYNDRHQEDIDRANNTPDGEVIHFDLTAELSELPPLEVAVTLGLSGVLPQAGALELCWSHATAVKLQTPSGIHLPGPGGMALPPGMNGMGGPR